MGRAIRELVHYLDVTAHVIKMAFMTIIEYPSNIAGWMISNPLQFIMGFAIIKFVVESFGEINGWNYGQLAFLYGLSVISHALSMIFRSDGPDPGRSCIYLRMRQVRGKCKSALYPAGSHHPRGSHAHPGRHIHPAGKYLISHKERRGFRAVHSGDHGQDYDVPAVHVP